MLRPNSIATPVLKVCISLKFRIDIICSLVLFCHSTNSKAQVYGWLTTISPGGNEYCWDVAADDFGNFFGTGRVKANSTFGSPPYTASPPMIGPETDVFLAKYRKNGQLVWAQRHGGVQPDWGRCVITDKDGNAIVAGDYCDTANFGPFFLDAVGTSLNRNIFIVKYDSSGNCLWAKTAGNSANYSRAYGATTDAAGNVYIGGHISGPSNFDGITFGISGKNVPFIAKFSPAGICQWVKHINCGYGGEVYDLIYNNANDKVYVTGTYRGSIVINSVVYPGNSPSWSDVFVLEMDNLGNFGWIKTALGNFQDMPNTIDLDSSGNVYIAGTFAYGLNFGTVTINPYYMGGTAADANNHVNGFIAKYSASGVFDWVETIKSDTLLWFDDIVITTTGKLLSVTSYFGHTFLQDDTIYAAYDRERSVITAYDLDGNQLWYKATATGQPLVSQCAIRGIARNNQDDIIIGGEYAGTFCYFDSMYDPSASGWDAFLAKLYMPLEPRVEVSDTALCVGDTITFNFTQEGSEISYNFLSPPPGLTFITSQNPFKAVVTDAFSYSLSVQVSNPMQSQTFNFGITINAQESPELNLADTTICPTASVNYSLDPSHTYTWFDSDNASNKTFSVPGTYWVNATSTYGCESTDTFSIANFSVNNEVISLDSVSFCSGDTVTVNILTGFSSPVWFDSSTSFTHTLTSTGSFSVNAQDINGCQATDVVYANALAAEPFSLGNDTVVCDENPLVFNAPATHSNYQWSDGTTGATVNVDTTTTLSLTCDDMNGCVFTDAVMITWDECLGMNEVLADGISVYPNPFTSEIFIQTQGAAYVEVFNVYGQKVMNRFLGNAGGIYQLNFDKDLEPGIYFFNVLTKSGKRQFLQVKQ